MKKLCRTFALVFALLLLCGCTPFALQNVNDLLRAPALGQGWNEIQNALVAYLGGQAPQYKYPKEGTWRSPLLLADLNGDGSEEAILLYSLAEVLGAPQGKGNYVYLAVLKKAGSGWVVVQDIAGLATDIASIQVANLLGTNSLQLIVGYATSNFNAKTLAIYSYTDEKLVTEYSLEYSRYEIADFTGRGGEDMVVVSRTDQPGSLQLRYITAQGENFPQNLDPVALDANFISCAGIYASTGAAGQPVLLVDGTVTESGALASQLVFYSGQRFYTLDDFGAMRGATARSNPLLRARDIDGDGSVEIPLRVGRTQIITTNSDMNLEYIEWMDFTDTENPAVFKQFGMLDSDRGLYISLPNEWRDSLSVVSGTPENAWQILNKETGMPLLSLAVLPQGSAPPVGGVPVAGTTGSYLVTHTGVAAGQRQMVHMVLL